MPFNNYPTLNLNSANLDWLIEKAGEEDVSVKVVPQQFSPEEKEIARNNIGAAAGVSDAVRYTPQSLSAAEKAQARQNIGVGGGESSVLYTPQELTPEQQTQARENINAQSADWIPSAEDIGAVPVTRKINNKALTGDISLTASDVSAVPRSRTVNGHALSSNIELTAADVGARPDTWTPTADDVGARPDTWMPTAAQTGALPAAFSDVVSDAWNETTTYNAGDYCIFNNQLWKCKTQHSGVPPVDGAYWAATNATNIFKPQRITFTGNSIGYEVSRNNTAQIGGVAYVDVAVWVNSVSGDTVIGKLNVKPKMGTRIALSGMRVDDIAPVRVTIEENGDITLRYWHSGTSLIEISGSYICE